MIFEISAGGPGRTKGEKSDIVHKSEATPALEGMKSREREENTLDVEQQRNRRTVECSQRTITLGGLGTRKWAREEKRI